MSAEMTTTYLRRAVLVVAVLNVLYGIVEFGVALVIGSVSLFADSARRRFAQNVAIIAAGAVTAYLWHSVWPDLIVVTIKWSAATLTVSGSMSSKAPHLAISANASSATGTAIASARELRPANLAQRQK
jgi:Co/Zn/Cd efflux system component